MLGYSTEGEETMEVASRGVVSPGQRGSWTTRVFLPNNISFCPTVLAGCTSVTDDTHTDSTDVQTKLYGNIVSQ